MLRVGGSAHMVVKLTMLPNDEGRVPFRPLPVKPLRVYGAPVNVLSCPKARLRRAKRTKSSG